MLRREFTETNRKMTQMKNLPLLSLGMIEDSDWADVSQEIYRELRNILRERNMHGEIGQLS